MKNKDIPMPTLSWFEEFKDKLSLQKWLAKLNITTDKIIEVSSYLGVGFLLGFLLKRSFKYFIMAIIASLLVIWGLHSINALNWENIRIFLGMKQNSALDSALNEYVDWVRHNLTMVITVLIGFFLGFKVG